MTARTDVFAISCRLPVGLDWERSGQDLRTTPSRDARGLPEVAIFIKSGSSGSIPHGVGTLLRAAGQP